MLFQKVCPFIKVIQRSKDNKKFRYNETFDWFFCRVRSENMAHNGLQLGEVADLEALTFNLALMFI